MTLGNDAVPWNKPNQPSRHYSYTSGPAYPGVKQHTIILPLLEVYIGIWYHTLVPYSTQDADSYTTAPELSYG